MHKIVGIVLVGLSVATQVSAQDEPTARIYHSMVALDANRGALVFGGVTQHGWAMDLHDVWRIRTNPIVWEHAADLDGVDMYSAAFDSQSNRVIVFSVEGATWAFDPDLSTWEQMSPAVAPSFRCGQRTVYDVESDRVVLFGGFGCTSVQDPVFSDTWAYDYEADRWERLEPELSPPPRMYHAMAYDPRADRVVVWGGRVEDSSVWSFDYNTNSWERQTLPGGPDQIRAYHTMTYDPGSDAFLVFGGLELDEPLAFEGALRGDTWSLDLDSYSWEEVDTGPGSPSPRSHHAAIYDEILGRVLVYGGETDSPYSGLMSGEIWSFDSTSRSWVLAGD